MILDEAQAPRLRLLFLLLIAVAIPLAGCAPLCAGTVPGDCGSGWWKYVYSPKRFIIQKPCITVRGVVTIARYALDGDAVVIVRLDPEYAHLSNERNREGYGKDTLELEIICRHPVLRFFVARCWKCNNKIPVPRVGDHVEADGIYVLDKNHGHMEIHPVTRLITLAPVAERRAKRPLGRG